MIKTTSLETSKLLKDDGFGQDTELFWYEHKQIGEPDYSNCIGKGKVHDDTAYIPLHWNKISAPTTDELFEELPSTIKYDEEVGLLKMFITKGGVHYGLFDNLEHTVLSQCNESLPEALAKMWLYLKKEGLLNAKS